MNLFFLFSNVLNCWFGHGQCFVIWWICVYNVQIILRDLQPTEENHNIDTVVTMKRYSPPFQHLIKQPSWCERLRGCLFLLQGRLRSCFLRGAEHWKVRGHHHSSCIMKPLKGDYPSAPSAMSLFAIFHSINIIKPRIAQIHDMGLRSKCEYEMKVKNFSFNLMLLTS